MLGSWQGMDSYQKSLQREMLAHTSQAAFAIPEGQ
jgi:hypothetical protein